MLLAKETRSVNLIVNIWIREWKHLNINSTIKEINIRLLIWPEGIQD